MVPVPLIASVAAVVAALTVLTNVADTLADRRREAEVRVAAMAPSVTEEQAPVTAEPEVVEPAAPAPPEPAAPVPAPEPAVPQWEPGPVPPEEAIEAEAAPDAPAAPEDGQITDEAPPDEAPPDEPPIDEPGNEPFRIVPPEPQAPVELAEPQDEPAPAEEGGDDARVAVLAPETAPEDEQTPSEAGGGRIVIAEGNNLWDVARAIYGSGVYYLLIFEANRDRIGDPNDIWPGQELVTPGVVPPEHIPPGLRDPIEGLEIDLPEGIAAELEAKHRAQRRR